MKKLFFIPILLILMVLQVQAQLKSVKGKVHAFKDLPLNKIKVVAKKAKIEALTDSEGNFKIVCDKKDKLEFTGEGFQKVSQKLEGNETNITIKMILKTGSKSQEAAVNNGHVTEDDLLQSIESFPEYNFNYYNYPDVYTLIDKIYQNNYNISVHGNSVYVRKDYHSNFSRAPAIYIVDGKAALEIKDILPRNIETLKVIPDGSKIYGPRAIGGVVKISTLSK